MSGYIGAYFLVIARLGTAFMFLPVFGEAYIPARPRLMLMVAICLALFPAIGLGPVEFDGPVEVVRVLAVEITIGVWIGVMARTIMSALQFAGMQIGTMASLANAFSNDSGTFQGATMISHILILGGYIMILVTNTHHVMIEALVSSYQTFPLGEIIPGDMLDQAAKVVSYSMYVGLSLSAPFYVLGILNNVAMGLANRMMPNLPVFFVAASLLITLGLVIFIAALPSILTSWTALYADWFSDFKL